MSEWKPIETAPKDRSEILLFWWETISADEPPMATCGVCAWQNTATYPDVHMCWTWADTCEPIEYEPTHWQPLPPPPSEEVKP